jgi:hypothetical protein
MANNPVEIPIKLNGLGQIKSELRALKGELASATDPKQMAELAEKAGELSDRLKDANEKVAVFASGSKFEQTSNAFGLMKSQLMDMDFEGAAESAKMFSSTLTSISPKAIGAQLKGLVSVVGTLGKAFMTFGIQLLANPIFLLIVVITAIVAAVIWFANKMGWLGAIFKAVKEALQPLIDAIKWFLDLIGLTNYAQEERTAAALAGYKAEKEAMDAVARDMDIKIMLLEAEGKSTIALRQEKNKMYLADAKKNHEAMKAMTSMMDVNSTMGKSYASLTKDAEETYETLHAEEIKLTQEVKAENKKRADDHKAYQKERLEAQRLIRDLSVAQMEEGINKELELNKIKYQRLIVDTKANEKYTADEKKKLVALYAEQERIEALKLYQKQADELQVLFNNIEAKKIEEKKKFDEEQRILEEEKRKLAFETLGTEQSRELALLKQEYAAKYSLAKDNFALTYTLTEEEKKKQAEINERYRLAEIEKEQALRDAKISFVGQTVEGIGELGKIFINDQKKLEKVNKAMALVQIGIDTAKAISALVATAQANPLNSLTFGGAGLAQYASGIIQIITNIAKAKALLSNPSASVSGGSSGGGGGASGGGTNAEAMQPQFNMFGSAGNANTINASGQPNSNNITVTAVVSETEITSTQNNINRIKESASL